MEFTSIHVEKVVIFSNLEGEGWGGLKKFTFLPFRPQFGLKIGTGGGGSPGIATAVELPLPPPVLKIPVILAESFKFFNQI